MPKCHVPGEETDAEDGFVCNGCGLWTCNMCGDGDLCSLCVGDEVFLADILGLARSELSEGRLEVGS